MLNLLLILFCAGDVSTVKLELVQFPPALPSMAGPASALPLMMVDSIAEEKLLWEAERVFYYFGPETGWDLNYSTRSPKIPKGIFGEQLEADRWYSFYVPSGNFPEWLQTSRDQLWLARGDRLPFAVSNRPNVVVLDDSDFPNEPALLQVQNEKVEELRRQGISHVIVMRRSAGGLISTSPWLAKAFPIHTQMIAWISEGSLRVSRTYDFSMRLIDEVGNWNERRRPGLGKYPDIVPASDRRMKN